MSEEKECPTVRVPVEAVVSENVAHEFFDDGVTYSHKDFGDRVVSTSCVFLDVEYDEWTGHVDGYKKGELTVMISKSDAVFLAKKFNLTADDISR